MIEGIKTQRRFSSHTCAGSGPTQPKESMMRFFIRSHRFYCGIDLHTRSLHLCILDQTGGLAPQPVGPGKRSAGFDPLELFGAVAY